MNKIIWSVFITLSFLSLPLHGTKEDILRIQIYYQSKLSSVTIASPDRPLKLEGWSGTKLKINASGNLLRVHAGAADKTFQALHLTAPRDGLLFYSSESSSARRYNGVFQITARKNVLKIINEIPVEDYVRVVLASEAPDMDQPEALKAMAIVSRSYALAERNRHRSEGFDYCDSPHCQVYRHTADIPLRLAESAESTDSTVLTYDGRIIPAYYHACCGGHTENSGDVWKDVHYPFLLSVSDVNQNGIPYCRSASHFKWKTVISLTELNRVARSAGWIGSKEKVALIEIKRHNPSGRLSRLGFQTSKRKFTVRASDFFRVFGRVSGWNRIRSTWFDISACDRGKVKYFCFDGRGYGHGVGFCQAGAEGMATQGIRYEDILHHYFHDIKIEKKES